MIPAIEKSRTKPQKNPAGVHVMIFFRQGVRTPQSLAHTAARLHSKTEKDRPFPPCSQAAVVTTVGPKVVANWRPMQLVGRPLVIGDVGVVFWSRAGAVSGAVFGCNPARRSQARSRAAADALQAPNSRARLAWTYASSTAGLISKNSKRTPRLRAPLCFFCSVRSLFVFPAVRHCQTNSHTFRAVFCTSASRWRAP